MLQAKPNEIIARWKSGFVKGESWDLSGLFKRGLPIRFSYRYSSGSFEDVHFTRNDSAPIPSPLLCPPRSRPSDSNEGTPGEPRAAAALCQRPLGTLTFQPARVLQAPNLLAQTRFVKPGLPVLLERDGLVGVREAFTHTLLTQHRACFYFLP